MSSAIARKIVRLGVVYQLAHREFADTMWLVYRRGGGSAVLNHDPGKVPLSTKDKVNSLVGGVCVSVHGNSYHSFFEYD